MIVCFVEFSGGNTIQQGESFCVGRPARYSVFFFREALIQATVKVTKKKTEHTCFVCIKKFFIEQMLLFYTAAAYNLTYYDILAIFFWEEFRLHFDPGHEITVFTFYFNRDNFITVTHILDEISHINCF